MTDAGIEGTEPRLRASLKHWEKRRASDIQTVTNAPPNIMPFLARLRANQLAFWHLQRHEGVDLGKAQILDAGSSDGYGMAAFMAQGIEAPQLTGVDLLEDRLARGRVINPGPTYVQSNIADIKLPDASFDITCEQFCFVHCPVEEVRQKGARELVRLTRRGGHILVLDWRYSRKSSDLYGVNRAWINEHFGVGTATKRVKVIPAMLIPPVGRPVSAYVPDLYFLIGRLLPFLIGAQLTILKKL